MHAVWFAVIKMASGWGDELIFNWSSPWPAGVKWCIILKSQIVLLLVGGPCVYTYIHKTFPPERVSYQVQIVFYTNYILVYDLVCTSSYVKLVKDARKGY